MTAVPQRSKRAGVEERHPDMADGWALWWMPTHRASLGVGRQATRQAWANLVGRTSFSIKPPKESSAGNKVFLWQTLGRAGGSRMGTGEIEKLNHLPSIIFYLFTSTVFIIASTALV